MKRMVKSENICAKSALFLFVFFFVHVLAIGQISQRNAFSFKDRVAVAVEAGAYLDQSMLKNEYLVKPNYTINITPYLMIAPRHFMGLHIGAQTCNLQTENIEEAFYGNVDHEELKGMTYGYDNIYQLGLSYRFLQVFKSGFAILPSLTVGGLWAGKEGHSLTFYPSATDPNVSKRFGTFPADDHFNFGAYVAGKLDAGYHWESTDLTLFGGFRFLMGEAEQKNQYVEEWANSGTFIAEFYLEKRPVRMMSFEVGIMLSSF